MTEDKTKKIRKITKIFSFIILILVILWFALVLIEMYRVKTEKRPLICFNEIKDIEDDDEYSLTCYGMLYKYREYHFDEDDEISAREFTLVFKEFERRLGEN